MFTMYVHAVPKEPVDMLLFAKCKTPRDRFVFQEATIPNGGFRNERGRSRHMFDPRCKWIECHPFFQDTLPSILRGHTRARSGHGYAMDNHPVPWVIQRDLNLFFLRQVILFPSPLDDDLCHVLVIDDDGGRTWRCNGDSNLVQMRVFDSDGLQADAAELVWEIV